MNTGKREYISSVEDFEPINTDVDHSKKAFMITFPYPYMNGKLHLGHLFSLSKCDFYAYFKRQQGYNVLFPFAFHCTGMPISASAYKLNEELNGRPVDVSVVQLLNGLGFEDVKPFTNPLHWIRTLPGYAMDSLKNFHAGIDWRRRFITTDLNPYYDSFVRYQFNKLNGLGLLDFGKRYSIFCPIDQQACLDHDRRKGEGVKPIAVILRKVPLKGNAGTLLAKGKNAEPVEKVVFCRTSKMSKFKLGDRLFLIESAFFDNLKYQVEGIELVGEAKMSELSDIADNLELIDKEIQGVVKTKCTTESEEFKSITDANNEKPIMVESEHFVKVLVPEDTVISRSGAKCVVSLLDQWYINYQLPEWKAKARKCLERMALTSDTRAKISEHLEGLNKWGFSRSFGLGTRIPWDKQYLIDSLSDSTIYNAFYTVKHFMFNDLEGKDEIFPTSLLCDDVWKFIFGDISTVPDNLKSQADLLGKCRESFEYFYPVDMRVTGKDLLGNHILFYILNHVALFDEKYWPRGLFSNGHLMLNSAKMSKSDNNFLTVDDCLTRYGVSATRVCLADCGDTNEDANFIESVANAMILRLYTFTKTVESLEIPDQDEISTLLSRLSLSSSGDQPAADQRLVDEMFVQWISYNITETLKAHETMIYRDVLKYGFYENIRLIELYKTLNGSDQRLICFGYKTILSLLYPIIPSLSNYLIKLKFNGDFSVAVPCTDRNDMIKAVEHVKAICSKINAQKRDSKGVEICVARKFPLWKQECMKAVDQASDKSEIMEKAESTWIKHGIKKSKALMFCMDYFNQKHKYDIPFDEFEILSRFTDFIEKSCEIKVKVVEENQGEPLVPVLRMEH